MPFEQFKSSGRGASQNMPTVSLRKSGGIGLNKATVSEWFEDATHVNLYYDKEENRVGIEPLQGSGPHSYKINKTDGSGSLTPSAFMNRYNLTPDITTRYEPEWSDEEELVSIPLSQENQIGTYGQPQTQEENKEKEE